MNSCEECPLVSSMARYVEHWSEQQAASMAFIAGIAQLAEEIPQGTAITDIALNGLDQAVKARSEQGKQQLVPFLASQPELAGLYFKALDSSNRLIEKTEGAADRLQQACNRGPLKRKQFLLFGDEIIRCRSRAYGVRLSSPRYPDNNES